MEDEQIIALYLKRDQRAPQLTADKYGPRLRTLALGILQDAGAAEECENDTYLAAWNHIPPHEPYGYFYAFLARITRHLALDGCRKRQRLKRRAHILALSRELEQCLPAPSDAACLLEEHALSAALNGFLATLGQEARRVFLRRYWYLDSVAVIARRYGFSQSKVKAILFRCRRQLRAYLEKEGYEL